jgi:diguanylate cyclase (GGDEF)-like protein
MRASRLLGALDTRVGLRTFMLFGACALVPIALFATWSYRIVSAELTQAAMARLQESSKRYGVLVNERLYSVETALIERARRRLSAKEPFATSTSPQDSRFQLLEMSIRTDPQAHVAPTEGSASWHAEFAASVVLSRRLEILRGASQPAVRILVTVSGNGKIASAVAELNRDYLWNTDSSEIAEAESCVRTSTAILLYCTSEDDASTATVATKRDRVLRAEWRLFLKPAYGVDEWIFTTRQSEGVALRSLHAFQTTLPFVAALALGGALLLSLVHIRRSHGPLRTLIAATRRLGRGRFGRPIRLSGRDEYTGLARAFNRLSARLKRQFRLSTAFSELDHSMLHHPALEPILGEMLPRVLDVLNCDIVVAVILRPDSEVSRVISIGRQAPRACESRNMLISEQDLQALTANPVVEATSVERSALLQDPALRSCHCSVWHAAPIRLGTQHRGALVLGFSASRPARRSTPRHVAELARRVAVALSNEDRDRALIKQAYSDALTGLANRQLFCDRLERELERSRRLGSGGAVLFMDLDRFKNINDSLGHSAGDQMLKTAAERLRPLTRECDTLARLGGDEFTLICPDLDPHAAGALAGRILEALSVPEELAGMRCVIEASIGVACFPQDGVSAETVLRNADTAMYRAKFSGGAKTTFFEESMNSGAVRRLRIEQRLRQALDEGRLTLHLQPKLTSGEHSLAGAEALMRWHDPEDGPQAPAEFIKIAEECGLIVRLGTWALDYACSLLKQWRDRGLPIGHIAVNVSAQQLRDADFPDIVQRCMERHGLPRGCLELEITESTLMHDVEQVSDVLRRVKAIGVRVAIDDFGTGYSSLAILQRLPVDILKIDQAFVRAAMENPEGVALFDTLVSIGRALGRLVVVEGIETAAQARFAEAHGGQVVQGYFFGGPLPAEAFVRTWLGAETADTVTPAAVA